MSAVKSKTCNNLDASQVINPNTFEQVSDSWTISRCKRRGEAPRDYRPIGLRCVRVPKDILDSSANRAHRVLVTNLPAAVLSHHVSRVTVTDMPLSATRTQVIFFFIFPYKRAYQVHLNNIILPAEKNVKKKKNNENI